MPTGKRREEEGKEKGGKSKKGRKRGSRKWKCLKIVLVLERRRETDKLMEEI